MPSRFIAVSFAMVCYTLSLVAGLFAGRALADVMLTGLMVLVVTWFLGSVIGGLIQRELDRALRTHQSAHPIPTPPGTRASASARSGRAESVTPTPPN